jgi:hypothetical protein
MIGVLTGTLLLPGCMPAMPGHATHKKHGAAHEQGVKSRDSERPAASKAEAPLTPVAPVDESPAPTQASAHTH